MSQSTDSSYWSNSCTSGSLDIGAGHVGVGGRRTSVSGIANDELPPPEPTLGSPADEIQDRATGTMSRPLAGRHEGAREWYIVDEREVRIGAAIVAVVLVVAAGLLAWRSNDLSSEGDAICAACENGAFDVLQTVLSSTAIALALVLVVYLARLAVTGRMWPYRRAVTIAFLVVVSLWSLLVIAVVFGPF